MRILLYFILSSFAFGIKQNRFDACSSACNHYYKISKSNDLSRAKDIQYKMLGDISFDKPVHPKDLFKRVVKNTFKQRTYYTLFCNKFCTIEFKPILHSFDKVISLSDILNNCSINFESVNVGVRRDDLGQPLRVVEIVHKCPFDRKKHIHAHTITSAGNNGGMVSPYYYFPNLWKNENPLTFCELIKYQKPMKVKELIDNGENISSDMVELKRLEWKANRLYKN